jgi:pyruvate/2-oxoglutarate/acetoin dehydrogenase E1 component
MREIGCYQAISEAQLEELKRENNSLLIGIDIRNLGSAMMQSTGIYTELGGDRVIDMPLSESGYVEMAVGLAVGGIRTIVEVQFADFLTYAFDAIVNQASKFRYLSDGKMNVPLVIRAAQGSGFFFGAQHSQCVEGWFMNVPGLKIVVPATPYDAKGLLKTAFRDDDPVLFLEHKACMFQMGEVPEPEEEYLIPLGKASIAKEGTDVTIIATQKLYWDSLAALEELEADGIHAELIDPRTLVPLDIDTLCTSAKKTGRVVVAHESPLRGGFGAEISSVITENCFSDLKAPVKRIGSANIPIPFGFAEEHILPQKKDVISSVKELMAKS